MIIPSAVKNRKIYRYITGERKIKLLLPLKRRKSSPKKVAFTDKYIINAKTTDFEARKSKKEIHGWRRLKKSYFMDAAKNSKEYPRVKARTPTIAAVAYLQKYVNPDAKMRTR